jgi:hypothetical protein
LPSENKVSRLRNWVKSLRLLENGLETLKDPTYPTMDREVPKTGALLGILTVPTAK